MARDWMHYDRLVQGALKGVARQILRRVQAQGLPGDHHIYVVFRTRHPGVVMPAFLRERYPEEMTIVLQHQFWGMEVFEDRFRVGLSFNKSPQELTIPFAAMKGFFDPSVQFGLQFDLEDVEAQSETGGLRSIDVDKAEAAKPDAAKSEPAKTEVETAKVDAPKPKGALPAIASPTAASPGEAPAKTPEARGEVVSLDSFRKK